MTRASAARSCVQSVVGDIENQSADLPGPGLSSDEVAQRVHDGMTNSTRHGPSRSVADIVRANVLTKFNAILGVLLVVILFVGPWQDALFGFVLLSNTTIGILQELRAKRTLDRLSVLVEQRIVVARDGKPETVGVAGVVLGDLILLRSGDQVVADGRLVASTDLEVDEALLTGEAEPRAVAVGEELRSGTIAVAGAGWYLAEKVGEQAYANQLAAQARVFRLAQSELRRGIDQILTFTAWSMVPIGALLLVSQLRAHDGIRPALAATVAGTMSMVPEGLVLLTSMALAMSVLRLGKRHVLIQELGAVELLARVDVVCFDKTGTLTDGSMTVERLESFDGQSPEDVGQAIGALAGALPPNGTLGVLGSTWSAPGWQAMVTAPFSSARKWSGATFSDHGTWLIGAPEILAAGQSGWEEVSARAAEISVSGRRVLAVATAERPLADSTTLPDVRLPAALISLAEQLRDDAADAIAFFGREGVIAKVISGDSPLTVQALAGDAGLVGDAIDARLLPTSPKRLSEVIERTTVFGRVLPEQKRAMVAALQAHGHTVAMTGDGVNDVLAVKQADLGIAIGSGAPATRAVARIVLLDGRFGALPEVVHEGRRVIANVERVANLFVSKTVYAGLLSLATGIVGWPFPFLPRHLSLIGSMTIGIPGFFLAFGPDAPRSTPGFVGRICRFAFPAGVLAAVATFSAFGLARADAATSLDEARTAATAALGVVGFGVLIALARPLTRLRAVLVVSMISGFAAAFAIPWTRSFFGLEVPQAELLAAACGCGLAAALLILSPLVAHRRLDLMV